MLDSKISHFKNWSTSLNFWKIKIKIFEKLKNPTILYKKQWL